MFRSSSLATLTLFGALGTIATLGSCWTGGESRGLPCETNEHCGLGLDCIDGFCGGEPLDGLCGNGYVDPSEACDEGEQNSDTGACKLDCTLASCGDGFVGPGEACDEGEQNSNTGACKLDCTPASCGDGFVGPGEACDGSDGCSPSCVLESCGNGILDPGEDCDDRGESPTCDDDCSEALCGDTRVNAAAGEACDNDSPAVNDRLCMDNCTVPLLWDDMEPDTPPAAWTHEKVSGDPSVVDTWLVTTRKFDSVAGSQRSWDSGTPADAFGDTRLMTPELDLGLLAGEAIELRFDHAVAFADCTMPVITTEGAVIEISVDGGPFQVIAPDDGYSGVAGEAACEPAELNPLDGQPAFTDDADYSTETVDLSGYAGATIKLGFRVGWDCGNCPNGPDDRGWFVDNVVVSIK